MPKLKTRWQDLVNIALGVWIGMSPWLIGFAGEIEAATWSGLVTGAAVSVAARLEQSAGPGEILLGDDTFRLVRDAVEADGIALDVKGKPATPSGPPEEPESITFHSSPRPMSEGSVERTISIPIVAWRPRTRRQLIPPR